MSTQSFAGPTESKNEYAEKGCEPVSSFYRTGVVSSWFAEEAVQNVSGALYEKLEKEAPTDQGAAPEG